MIKLLVLSYDFRCSRLRVFWFISGTVSLWACVTVSAFVEFSTLWEGTRATSFWIVHFDDWPSKGIVCIYRATPSPMTSPASTPTSMRESHFAHLTHISVSPGFMNRKWVRLWCFWLPDVFDCTWLYLIFLTVLDYLMFLTVLHNHPPPPPPPQQGSFLTGWS